MKAPKTAIAASSVLLASALTGCYERVEVLHPLCEIGDDVDATPFLGKWELSFHLVAECNFKKAPPGNFMTISPAPSSFEVIVQELATEEQLEMRGRITEIEGKLYFEAKSLTARDQAGKKQSLEYEVYQLLAKAICRDDQLWVAVSPLELNKELAAAVRSGELTGDVDADKTVVTDSAEALLEFLNDRPSSPTWSVACYKRVVSANKFRNVQLPTSSTLSANR